MAVKLDSLIKSYTNKAIEVMNSLPIGERESFTAEKVHNLALRMLLKDLNEAVISSEVSEKAAEDRSI